MFVFCMASIENVCTGVAIGVFVMLSMDVCVCDALVTCFMETGCLVVVVSDGFVHVHPVQCFLHVRHTWLLFSFCSLGLISLLLDGFVHAHPVQCFLHVKHTWLLFSLCSFGLIFLLQTQ